MLHSSLFEPFASFLLSTLAYIFAIQSARSVRFFISPILFGAAWYSLKCSYLFGLHSGINVLWALLNCVWMLHAASSLFFEALQLPRDAPSWISAYKSWADPQRQINWDADSPDVQPCAPTSRLFFALRRCLRAATICLVHVCVFEPLAYSFVDQAEAKDFSPQRQIFFRRLLWPDLEPVINWREIQIRFFVSMSWIWTTYLMLNVCHIILSIFFVAIVRVDAPEEWPPLFGSPLESYTIRRFWVKFWHKMTVPASKFTGRWVTRRVVRFAPNSRVEKLFLAFWAFLLSAIYHSIADWAAGEPCCPRFDLFFFVANFGAATIETALGSYMARLSKVIQNRSALRVLSSHTGRRLLGHVWVFGFFFWAAPKWQYPKLEMIFHGMQQ